MTEYAKFKSGDFHWVIGHRAGAMMNPPGAVLQLQLATSGIPEDSPRTLMLQVPVEELEKLIASLQDSLTRIRQAN